MSKETARLWYLKNRELTIARSKAWAEENPDKARQSKRKCWRQNKAKYMPRKIAGNSVRQRIKNGRLKRPDQCSVCHQATSVEGHHYNGYDRRHRYDVRWLCRTCHAELHRK